ncbi:hypothetical protein BB560_006429 [Smittium megazygosporum]|uniref:Uncharacterized protein n=1 Tax=Smittium megazygosporum TaxID=133381 RepID=A0A2T9Y651_9FUNG|nr:hypothetical protein BB560_006429 [Smittium megazygosporum]
MVPLTIAERTFASDKQPKLIPIQNTIANGDICSPGVKYSCDTENENIVYECKSNSIEPIKLENNYKCKTIQTTIKKILLIELGNSTNNNTSSIISAINTIEDEESNHSLSLPECYSNTFGIQFDTTDKSKFFSCVKGRIVEHVLDAALICSFDPETNSVAIQLSSNSMYDNPNFVLPEEIVVSKREKKQQHPTTDTPIETETQNPSTVPTQSISATTASHSGTVAELSELSNQSEIDLKPQNDDQNYVIDVLKEDTPNLENKMQNDIPPLKIRNLEPQIISSSTQYEFVIDKTTIQQDDSFLKITNTESPVTATGNQVQISASETKNQEQIVTTSTTTPLYDTSSLSSSSNDSQEGIPQSQTIENGPDISGLPTPISGNEAESQVDNTTATYESNEELEDDNVFSEFIHSENVEITHQ